MSSPASSAAAALLGAGGIWTTAPVMGAELIERLQANAGLTFAIES